MSKLARTVNTLQTLVGARARYQVGPCTAGYRGICLGVAPVDPRTGVAWCQPCTTQAAAAVKLGAYVRPLTTV